MTLLEQHSYELTGDLRLYQYGTKSESLTKERTCCDKLLKIEDRWRPYDEDRRLHRFTKRKQN